MNPYEMMFRSGVMSQYRPIRRWQERRMINQALRDVMPVDKSWQVILLATAVIAANVILFVRWWLA